MGADPAAIGKPLQLNGHLYTVVGILPPDYRSIYGSGFAPEVYVPSAADSGRAARIWAANSGFSTQLEDWRDIARAKAIRSSCSS